MGYCMDFVHNIVLTEYLRLENRYKDYLSASGSLFVFSIDDPKQNAISLLTPVSNKVSSTTDQILSGKWLLKLPWRAKPKVTLERT